MTGFRTCGTGSFELVEKKSVFIADVTHVSTETEALAFIAKIKKKYPDATHHVTAYVLRENTCMRFSDDGEPSGTAGKPALEVLLKEEIKDVCLVITRWFGGIKLGAGGLCRAYAASAKGALDSAGCHLLEPHTILRISCTYADSQSVADSCKRSQLEILSTDYSATVLFTVKIPSPLADFFIQTLADRTSGRVQIEKCGEELA